ncbi:DNA-binding protein [Alkalihalobacterium alkalinitrilicum]|uniref:DNA-binding protein n=1 Tax=Alkalihalobacterium alkalinitrilicum TaxID=427920 RepID=UPI00099580C0|nr:DNA-binding protein [Alkalihalobacterium alkalinitrilicum]
MEYIWLAMGIAIAGYLIGDGLKNFKNPNSKNILDSLDESDDHELIKENEVHHFIGISKEDAKNMVSEHPNIPHIIINNKIYYPKAKLREWLMKIGN